MGVAVAVFRQRENLSSHEHSRHNETRSHSFTAVKYLMKNLLFISAENMKG